MSKIVPFRALRPAAHSAASFSSAAYDSEHRENSRLHDNGEPAYLKILLPGIFSDHKLSQEECYAISQNRVNEYLENEVLIQDGSSAFYVYRQMKGNNTFTTIIGLASIEEYKNGKIKRHELTREDKEEKITAYFREVGINGSAVLLTYPAMPHLNEFIADELVAPAPVYDFTDAENVHHQVWVVDDEAQVAKIQDYFSGLDALYIADGHHRCAATALLYPDCKSFMACLIPDSDILIHAFHRYLRDFSMPMDEFLQKLSAHFQVEKSDTNNPVPAPGIIYMYTAGSWYRITIPDDLKNTGNPKERLDVFILDKYIFGDILNIRNSRSSERLEYVHGAGYSDKLLEPVQNGTDEALFLLYPIEAAAVMAVSDNDLTMPPKSTWIEPKLRSGLLIHELKK